MVVVVARKVIFYYTIFIAKSPSYERREAVAGRKPKPISFSERNKSNFLYIPNLLEAHALC